MNKKNKKTKYYVNGSNLKSFCCEIFKELDLNEENANIISDSLIESNLRGVDTHGFTRLSIYVKRLEEGLINKCPEIKINQITPSTAVADGDNGPGQVVGTKAIEKAISMARKSGVGLVAVKHSNHFGAAAYYVQRAIKEDMIGIAFTNSEPSMIPFGGKKAFFGTNPISVGIPAGKELPIIVDMATSKVTRGNILMASKNNLDIPEGWAVDKNGEPTTIAENALNGALIPLAGPKGYCLAVIVEVFSSLLSSSSFGPHINSMYNNFENTQNVGHFLGAIDISGFCSKEGFKVNIDKMIREIKVVTPQRGFIEVYLPGELESRKKENRLQNGIPLTQNEKYELEELATKYNKEDKLIINLR